MPLLKLISCGGRAILQWNGTRPANKYFFNQMHRYRCISTEHKKHTKVLKTEKEKVRMYVAQRYVDYVKKYTQSLETRFPTAVKMYRVFSIGTKDFLSDLKAYIALRLRLVKDRGFAKMSRQEIELFDKMPADMWRIAPVLILSAIPFGNYVIFPLALLRPRKLLCSHFWSLQQRLEFSTQDLIERLRNNKPVFRALQSKLDYLPQGDLKENWRRILALLGSGVHPTPNEVLACKDLFTKEPYELYHLSLNHAGHLLKMHGTRKGLLRYKKLKYRAFILLEMDKAIIREGGVEKMNTECLRRACHIRGLNGAHLTNQNMQDWLSQWLAVSEHVDKNSYSLLLHCPIFFAYNHPQNWVLIY